MKTLAVMMPTIYSVIGKQNLCTEEVKITNENVSSSNANHYFNNALK